MKKPYVFISYSTKNAETANLVYSYLEGNGIPCWIASRNIMGGEGYATQIVDAIYDCAAFVLIASEHSNDSNHVNTEMSIAFSNKKKIIPFRLSNFGLSKANTYFLQMSQWIDAFDDMNAALKLLLEAVRTTLPTASVPAAVSTTPRQIEKATDDTPSLSREEIVNVLLGNIEKYPYCLKSRTRGEHYLSFKKLAKTLFDHTVSMYYRGKATTGGLDYVDIIVDTLSQGSGISVQVKGLPGCAKNMLLQLAYYKMLERFRSGESNYLPLYLSSSYYEKLPYGNENPRKEMTDVIKKDSQEFFTYIAKNPDVQPVLMVEAVREHVVSRFAPEDVMLELWRPFGKFNRIVAVDVGLIKNRLRHKSTIPLMGDESGYSFRFRSVPITDKAASMTVIRTVLDMYLDQYDALEAKDVYNALFRLRFSTLDIFTIRLVATELAQGRSVEEITLTDMYEHLAQVDLKGDDDKMLTIAKELYTYVFDDRHNVKTQEYNAVMWSLPHKHATYLEFMVAYHFTNCIFEATQNDGSCRFLSVPMTSMENHFAVSRLQDNYPLQESLLSLIEAKYDSFDIHMQSNAAYWLGKMSFADLRDRAIALLQAEYTRLSPVVKSDNRQTLANRCRQFLFRSVCNGLIAQGHDGALDEYLCQIVTNDVANAVNRGAVIAYVGDSRQTVIHNDYYCDDDPNIGEQAIRILCSKLESKLAQTRAGFVEADLISLLTLIQARMHIQPEKLAYSLTPFCEKSLELLKQYRKRPRSIVSEKLIYFLCSVEEDFELYLQKPRFDAAFTLFTNFSKMKEVKRIQWLAYGIEDCESVAEHTLSAWMMAMLFLPQEHPISNYDKQEIMDMLMVHDMAEAILGDRLPDLSEPSKELDRENEILRTLFMKGTYPEVANLTRFYKVWVQYYKGQSINARIARDINLIQTVNTFFDFANSRADDVSRESIAAWLAEDANLSTDLGCDLFERIISNNPVYRRIIDSVSTPDISAFTPIDSEE